MKLSNMICSDGTADNIFALCNEKQKNGCQIDRKNTSELMTTLALTASTVVQAALSIRC